MLLHRWIFPDGTSIPLAWLLSGLRLLSATSRPLLAVKAIFKAIRSGWPVCCFGWSLLSCSCVSRTFQIFLVASSAHGIWLWRYCHGLLLSLLLAYLLLACSRSSFHGSIQVTLAFDTALALTSQASLILLRLWRRLWSLLHILWPICRIFILDPSRLTSVCPTLATSIAQWLLAASFLQRFLTGRLLKRAWVGRCIWLSSCDHVHRSLLYLFFHCFFSWCRCMLFRFYDNWCSLVWCKCRLCGPLMGETSLTAHSTLLRLWKSERIQLIYL